MAGVVICLTLAACGGDTKLTLSEEIDISSARLAFSQVILNGSAYGDALDGVQDLIRIYREKPDAEYDTGHEGVLTVREVVADAASDLDRWQPDMAAELDRALEAGP